MKRGYVVLVLSFVFAVQISYSQVIISPPPPPSVAPDTFPAAWIGEWEGALHIFSQGKLSREIMMELHISPTDSTNRWTWTIIYHTPEREDIRHYEMVATAPESGHFLLDEKNSIAIDTYFSDNTFVSFFVVQNQLLFSKTALRNNQIHFEISFASMENKTISGGQGDTIPQVEAVPVAGFQTAILSRKK